MRAVTRQLERIGAASRWMLVIQRISQWGAALVAVFVGLGAIDFFLRLPGWLRLLIGLVVVAVAVGWLLVAVGRALGFRPSLSELAQRAERLYPKLAGSLASAVEFTTHAADYGDPPRTGEFARVAVERVRGQLGGVRLRKLLDPYWTSRMLMLLLVAVLAFASVVIAMPNPSRIAAARWFAPLGEARWPRRTELIDLTTEQVWPIDTPLRFAAEVRHGYRPGMRVWVTYRVIGGVGRTGEWRSLLLSEQASAPKHATFERLVELPQTLTMTGSGTRTVEAGVEHYFEAGDDRTATAHMLLVPRPAATAVTATITPPRYAAGLVVEQTVDMLEQSGPVSTAAGLAGSTVSVRIELNKAIGADALGDMSAVTPGLASIPGFTTQTMLGGRVFAGASADGLVLTFPMRETVETVIQLEDEYGLTNLAERRYRIESIEDRPPTATLVEPRTDEAVLRTAAVAIEALGRDDVGLEQLSLDAAVQRRNAGADAAPAAELGVQTGRRAELTVRHRVPLESMRVAPGDVVSLSATAHDVYDLAGQRHDPVRSSPRRLRIIDEVTLIGQLRNDLAGIRQHAIRLEQAQRRLRGLDSGAAAEQAQISRRIESQAALLDRLVRRAERNHLDAPALRELMGRAAELIDVAGQSSDAADQRLRRAADAGAALREQARLDQTRVGEKLRELVSLLDQGRDALTLQLRQLQTQQDHLAADTRRLLPRTAGRAVDELTPQLAERLKELHQQQGALAEQARALVRQMWSAADVLARQGERDRDRAAAETMAEAAAIADRQGLGQSMAESAASMQQNQLSQSGQHQNDSLNTMQQMLAELGTQNKRVQQMLRRRLRKLGEQIDQLVRRQTQQLARLDQTDRDGDLPALEPPQSLVRRSTLAAEQQAIESAVTEPIGRLLGGAVDEQADAIESLRVPERSGARSAEVDALASLAEALQLARRMSQQAASEQMREQRAAIKKEYERLAVWENQLWKRVTSLATGGLLDRKQKARLVELGHEQSDLQIDADELGKNEAIARTLVFNHLHQRVGEAADRVVRQLRHHQADEGVVADQVAIESMLATMAEALDQDPESTDFAGQTSDASGGGSGQRSLVPPVAELKLLRGLQQTIYDQTRHLGEAPAATQSARMRSRLMELSTWQRELSTLGESLLKQIHQGPGGQPPQEQ